MSVVLNTNMASLYAQKSLASSQADLATSVQRLSSGTRINTAKDDAAGLAIAEAVKATKNIADRSLQNTQDAISVVQTAQGALDVVNKMLQRVLTLTTQKENGSLSATQKSSVNTEIASLLNEVSHIQSRTKLQSGQSSIFGTTQTFTTGEGTSISISIADLSLGGKGLIGIGNSGNYQMISDAPLQAGQNYYAKTVTDYGLDVPVVYASGTIAMGGWNAHIKNAYITFTTPTDLYAPGHAPDISMPPGSGIWFDVRGGIPMLQGLSVADSANATVGSKIFINGSDSHATVNSVIDAHTVVSSADMTRDNNPLGISTNATVTFVNGSNVSVATTALDNSVLNHNPFSISTQTTGGVIYFDNRAGYAKVGGYITAGPFAGPEITSAGQWYTNFAAGDPGSPNPSIWYNSAIDTSYTSSTGGMGLVADNGFNSSSAHLYGMISSSDYYDVSGNIKNLTAAAVDPITSSAVFSAIQINTANQASLGSTQNRLNYIVDNIESLSSNAASAQGRIVDTNYASEMAQFSRGQILQQASTSVLAAANMAPNVALNILNNDGLNNDSMTRLRGG